MKRIALIFVLLFIPAFSFSMDAITQASPKCGNNMPGLMLELKEVKHSIKDNNIILKVTIQNNCAKKMSVVKLHYFLKNSFIFIQGKEYPLLTSFWNNLNSYFAMYVGPQQRFSYEFNLKSIKGTQDLFNKPGKYMIFWRHARMVSNSVNLDLVK